MAFDIGTYAIKDDLTAQFARMSAAALAFDKTLGNTRGAKKMSDSLDALAKDALKPLREMAKAQEKAAKEAAKQEQAAQRQMRAEQAAAAAFIRAEQRKQAEIERTRRAQEKNSTWNRAKSAFGEAVSPKQMAIGAARTVGAGMVSAPFAVLGAGFNLVEGITDKVIDVGKDLVGAVIDAAQFRQNAITGLEYMLGTRKEAEQIFADAQKLAQETPLDTDKVIAGIQQLVTAGFSGKDSMLLFKSVADQASKFAGDEGMQDKVIAAFSRVKGRGVATGEDLESMRVAGFREESIIQALREKENLAPLFKNIKKDASQEDVIKQVKKVLGEGKIGSTTFLNAVIASAEKNKPNIGEFAKRMGGGGVGADGKPMRGSLTGTISNFRSAFGDLLKSTNLESWKGIEAFQDFLTKISDAMKSDVGKGLLQTIERIVDALLGGLAQVKDSDIQGFVKTVADLGDKAVGVIKEAWGWLDRLLHGGDIGDEMGDILIDVAKYIGAGIWEGVKNAGSIIEEGNKRFTKRYGVSEEKATAKAAEMGMSTKDFLRFYSDAKQRFEADGGASTVFQQEGESAGDAFMRRVLEWNANTSSFGADTLPGADSSRTGIKTLNIPMLAEGGIVTSPTLAWVGEAGPEAVVPLRTMASASEASVSRLSGERSSIGGGQGRVGGVGSLSVQVNVGNVAGGDPSAVGNAIADITVERVLMALLERKAAEA